MRRRQRNDGSHRKHRASHVAQTIVEREFRIHTPKMKRFASIDTDHLPSFAASSSRRRRFVALFPSSEKPIPSLSRRTPLRRRRHPPATYAKSSKIGLGDRFSGSQGEHSHGQRQANTLAWQASNRLQAFTQKGGARSARALLGYPAVKTTREKLITSAWRFLSDIYRLWLSGAHVPTLRNSPARGRNHAKGAPPRGPRSKRRAPPIPPSSHAPWTFS